MFHIYSSTQPQILFFTMKFIVSALGLVSLVASTVEASMASRTLVPAHPPGHNATDPTHLVPKLTQALHYREDGKTGGTPISYSYGE